MKLTGIAVAVLLSFGLGQLPPKEGKIATIKDDKANFASFTTYTWEKGHQAYDPVAHKTIVEAVDAEMARRGFKQVPSGASVTLRYHTVVRTDVILDKLDEFERAGVPAPTKTLGRLIIVMRDAQNKQVWAADSVQQLSPDKAASYGTIKETVVRMFETYPGAKK